MSLTPVTASLVQIIPTVTMNGKNTVALANQVCVIFFSSLVIHASTKSIQTTKEYSEFWDSFLNINTYLKLLLLQAL